MDQGEVLLHNSTAVDEEGQVLLHSAAADAVRGDKGGTEEGESSLLWFCFTVVRWWVCGEWEVQAKLLCLVTAGGMILGW